MRNQRNVRGRHRVVAQSVGADPGQLLAFARDRKMIGLCFGHQLMADALGGSVRRHPGGPGIGIMEYRSADPTASGTIALPAWHFDQVDKVPPGARVTLSSDFCPVAGLAFADTAVSFQAHPEFSTAYLSDLIAYYGADKLGPEIDRGRGRANDRPAGRSGPRRRDPPAASGSLKAGVAGAPSATPFASPSWPGKRLTFLV